ncbi:MAG: phosphatase PAP2 family protein [Prevotella sp.]|nr:phosphatase PAP2 family protein [Candidatus Prevotella equi]
MGRFGFIAPELAQLLYAVVTALLILFTWTNISDPSSLLWQRFTFLSGTLALWVVYMLWPCKLVMLARISYLLATLMWWYPDTYELNHQFGCLDHYFATLEQDVFGMQPALIFSERFSSAIVSELMYFGYYSYYLFFVVTLFVVFFRDYKQLERVAFIVFGGFFICYCIYILLPVTGPQYYYLAVGTEEIARGSFPDVGHYFADSIEALPLPGWSDGVFYQLVHGNHEFGERPTAAFPSSHVAIATVVMLIVSRMRMWKYLLLLAIPYMFLCLSTVYIMAHYAVDSIAGMMFGIILFFVLGGMKLRKL